MQALEKQFLYLQNRHSGLQSGSYSDGLEALGELIHGKGLIVGAIYILHGGRECIESSRYWHVPMHMTLLVLTG